MIVSWHPERTSRVLLCCHYDTRPFPDRDPVPANRTKPFIGANDGGSGVALFMELGHHMPQIAASYGVDFVFFDAEELIYRSARQVLPRFDVFRDAAIATRRRRITTSCGVLVDMIGDKDLRIFQEQYSLSYAPTVTRSVWEAAARAGVREFVARRKHEVRDDHLPLNEIARIPTCDIIDFDYPHWHTRNDVPAACSGRVAGQGRHACCWNGCRTCR